MSNTATETVTIWESARIARAFFDYGLTLRLPAVLRPGGTARIDHVATGRTLEVNLPIDDLRSWLKAYLRSPGPAA